MAWRDDMTNLQRLFGQVKPYRGKFVLSVFLTIVLALIGPLRPLIIGLMITEFVEGAQETWMFDFTSRYVTTNAQQALLFWTIVVIITIFVEAVLQYWQTYLVNWIGQTIVRDMRNRLYSHLNSFRLKYFDQTPVGQLVTRVISDIEAISEVFTNGMVDIVGDILKLMVVIVLMFAVNWQFALISMIPIPLLLIATRIFARAMKKAFQEERREVNRLNTFVQEHLTGISIVQIFGRQKREKEGFDEINKAHRQAHIHAVWAFSIFFPVVEILSSMSLALLILWGVIQFDPEVTETARLFGEIFAYILWINMLFRPIRMLADKFNILQRGIVRWERVFQILEDDQAIPNEGGVKGTPLNGDIEFRNVWFAYIDEQWVLKDISFKASPGETIAFVGATGAGKSSIVNLLTRFYEYQKGEIHIDGRQVEEYDLKFLRSRISVVLQDVFLFSDTIHNNITFRNPEISRQEVIDAAKAIGAHDFIMKLPGNYDFNVQERGGMLSVGQRQMIAFIRAYVHNPDILVLDEATSSVDTESELLIQHAIEKLTQGRTSVIIAHRLSTIRKATRIVVVDKGTIIEQGSHEELLQLKGAYRRLYDLQFS
jgi:ATP-binding cassette subfamily B protein